MRAGWRRAGPVALFWLAGCGLLPSSERFAGASLELSQTPFFPQEQHQCGPAALATVLAADGVSITPDELTPQIFIPGREGSLQAELLAATRRQGRLPLMLRPDVAALHESLQAGKPVLLLQNLGLRRWPRWHYAVLIGFDAEADRFLLRSGKQRRERLSPARLMSSWDRAGRWAFAVALPGSIPVFAKPGEWIAAAAPLESLGETALAVTAFEAAVERWPDSALAWQALANARHAAHEPREAEQALRRALELDPAAVAARNNLAHLLLERGCPSAARRELDAIADIPESLESAVADTRAAAHRMEADAQNCP